MAEVGLPAAAAGDPGVVFNLHDTCGARNDPDIHEAVRRLVQAAGHYVEEMPHARERTICCGSGGMAPAVNPGSPRK